MATHETASQDLYRLNIGADLDPIFKKILLHNSSLQGHSNVPPSAISANSYLPMGGKNMIG